MNSHSQPRYQAGSNGPMPEHKPKYKLDYLEEIQELIKKAEKFKKSGNRHMYYAALEQINRHHERFKNT